MKQQTLPAEPPAEFLMKRGEIWTLQDDRYASKARPVIVLQNDDVEIFSSVILCLLTSFDSENIPTRVKIDPAETNGLRKTSYAMTDKIVTVRAVELGTRIGTLDIDQMKQISRQLAAILAITATDLA